MGKTDSQRLRHTTVTISAPARLHLGFLDLSGALGRRFGSLGLAIEGFRTRIGARAAAQVSVTGASAERARRCALQLHKALGDSSLNVRVAAAQALGQYGNEEDLEKALPVLLAMADQEKSSAYVSVQALNALNALRLPRDRQPRVPRARRSWELSS